LNFRTPIAREIQKGNLTKFFIATDVRVLLHGYQCLMLMKIKLKRIEFPQSSDRKHDDHRK